MVEMLPTTEPETLSEPLSYLPELLLLAGGLITLILLGRHHRRNRPDARALTDRLKRRAWEFHETYPVVLLLLLLFLSVMSCVSLFPDHWIPIAKLALTLSVYLTVSIIIMRNTRRRTFSPAAAFGLERTQLKLAAWALPLYLALVPFLLVSGIILKWSGYELPLQENARLFISSTPREKILFAGTALLAAPFFEELMFRGVLFPALLKRMGLISSIMLSSCLFALLHFNIMTFVILFGVLAIYFIVFGAAPNRWIAGLTRILLVLTVLGCAASTYTTGNFHSFTSLMILSIATATAYWRSGSLWTSIGLHALFNTVTLAFLYFTPT